MKRKPERTIVILAVTSEEQGLWGSAYYAQNPVYPIAKTLADINMDVLNWYGPSRDIVVIGHGQNELENYLKQEAEKVGREIEYDSHPEAGFYYRSDHFNFAKVGIPSLYTETGEKVIGKSPGYGRSQLDSYTDQHYHRPSDQFDPAWTFDGAIDDLQLLFQVGKRLAFTNRFPVWKEGSEFKALRDSMER